MCDALPEGRGLGSLLVEVHVEGVTGEVTEGLHIGGRDRAWRGEQAFADLEIFKGFAHRMHIRLDHRRAAHVFARHGHHHVGRALDGAALQVVLDGTDAAQFFAATGATGAAVLEVRQW